MRITGAAEVRAAIAAHMLDTTGEARRLGSVTLHDHQAEGADRISGILARHGGALLADDVGLGKTYIALAVARSSRAPIVIAPAALLPMWQRAFADTSVRADLCSHEMLSRGRVPAGAHDLVIVDEAHHLRSPRTARFAAATALCAKSRVLLITATPVQNRAGDLRTLFSLFLGQRAFALDTDALSGLVVRRREEDIASVALRLPARGTPRWLDGVDDADCLDELLALPPAVPPADGDDGGVLLTYTLVRQWASSRAALRGALRRRLAMAAAMEDALLAGRLPSRAELRAWSFADGTQQLAFPELMTTQPACDAATLMAHVRVHASSVRALLARLRRPPDPDDQRAALIRDVQRRHPGERLVCFSEYAATVTALFERLRPRGGCAMLTHAGGRLPSGTISRQEVLARFAPGARGTPGDRIDVLLSTDVLSEGVSLHDASVLVHLDLAWNPARLEQRVGRLRRVGASRDRVATYLMPPPAPADRLLDMEARLRAKLDATAHSVGLVGAILPGLAPSATSASGERETLLHLLRVWCGDHGDEPIAAAVRAQIAGAIACVAREGSARLLALGPHGVSDRTSDVLEMLRNAAGPPVEADPGQVRDSCAVVDRWLRRRTVSDVVDPGALHVARCRRILLRRVEGIARRTPRHAQPALAPLVNAARSAATATLPAGAERVLDVLARAEMQDDAWLRAVGGFASVHGHNDATSEAIVALLLLVADDVR